MNGIKCSNQTLWQLSNLCTPEHIHSGYKVRYVTSIQQPQWHSLLRRMSHNILDANHKIPLKPTFTQYIFKWIKLHLIHRKIGMHFSTGQWPEPANNHICQNKSPMKTERDFASCCGSKFTRISFSILWIMKLMYSIHGMGPCACTKTNQNWICIRIVTHWKDAINGTVKDFNSVTHSKKNTSQNQPFNWIQFTFCSVIVDAV